MRGENGSAERDRVVVLERAVDLDRLELRPGVSPKRKSSLPPDSSSSFSGSETTTRAPVMRFNSARPATWS